MSHPYLIACDGCSSVTVGRVNSSGSQLEATSLIERRIRLGDDHQIADDVDSAVRLLVQTHSADPAGMQESHRRQSQR